MATESEVAWAAGFYEGEGYFGVKHNSYGHPSSLRLSIGQRTQEPIDRFLLIAGVGKVYCRWNRGKDLWVYSAGKTSQALDVARLLWPWLSERRQLQVEGAVDEFMSVRHIQQLDVSWVVGGEYHR